MNWHHLFWIAAAILVLITLLPIVCRILRRQANGRLQSPTTAWLVAGVSSGTTLLSIAAQVTDVIPNVTVVDVAALSVTGVLTGLFLAFALGARHSGANER